MKKQIISAFFSVTLLLMTVLFGASAKETDHPDIIWGDADFDSVVSVSDVTTLQRLLANIDTLSVLDVVNDTALLDIDGDGRFLISDATVLQKYVANFDGVPQKLNTTAYVWDSESGSYVAFTEKVPGTEKLTSEDVLESLAGVQGIELSSGNITIKGTDGTKTWATIYADASPGKVYVLEFYGKTNDDSYQDATGPASLLTVEFLNSATGTTKIGDKYNGFVMGTTKMGYHRYGFVSPWGTKRLQLRFVTRGENEMTIKNVKLTELDSYPTRHSNAITLDGHLGAVLIAPRNTMPSFELGKIAGYSTMITNIKATSDGVLVALHDQTIDTTAYGVSGNVNVSTKTFAELQEYDFGRKFNAAYTGTKIPKFETVVKFLANSGIRLGVSIHGTLSDQNLADMCDIIKKYDMQDCLIKSFDMKYIKKVHAILGSDAEYMLCFGSAGPTTDNVDDMTELNARAAIEFNCNYTTSADTIVPYCEQKGVKTSAYTVNNVQLMKSLIRGFFNIGFTVF